ncbi:MAG TPA: NAD(P)/FAD-dependent oxidoreductase, partial [Roseiflexaceae bacterium]
MYDLIIIGGGAAALSAAVYALGKQLNVLVIYENLGGKAGTRQHLRGQVGEEYVAGADAAHVLEQQVAAHPERTLAAHVTDVSKGDGVFHVATESHGVLQSMALIVATGATPHTLDAPGAREMLNQGLGYSATTHSHIVAGKNVAVIGTTVRALRGAAELARSAAKVYLIEPEAFDADVPLANALRQRANVEVLEGYHVKSVNGPFNVETLVVEREDQHRWLRVDAAFVDLGLTPNSDIVRRIVRTDADGFIWIDELNATTLPGLFAAGDVTTAFGEQILIAIGDG